MRPLPTMERYLESNGYQRGKIRKMYERRGEPLPHALQGKPSPLKGRERPNLKGPRGPYPHKWVSGPDPVRHEQFTCWHRHRAQAIYRREPYELTFEDFATLWGDKWQRRGRGINDYCLSRQDPTKPWNITNTKVITRQEHLTKPRTRK